MATETKTELKLTPRAAAISEALQKHAGMAIDKTNAVVPDAKLINELLDDEAIGGKEDSKHHMTAERLKEADSFREDAAAGYFHAFGVLSQKHLQKHKDVDQVTCDKGFHIGKTKVKSVFHREVQVPGFKGAEPTTRHGWITGGVTTSVGSMSGSSIKSVRLQFAEQGEALFGGKK
jgi:hypothetical protein